MRRGRGFTLMELAVAMAIAGIVTAVAANMYVAMMDVMKSSQARARLVEQGGAALDYLLEEAATAGGPQVPVRASVIVEPACAARGPFPACGGTDRLTVVQPLQGYRVCAIDDEPSEGELRVSRLMDGACCLADRPPAGEGPFMRHALLTRAGPPPLELPVLLTLRSEGTCTFDYQPLVPRDAMPRPLPPGQRFTNGAIQLVDVKTFYVEPSDPMSSPGLVEGTLVMHTELDGDLGSAIGERLDLLKHVWDFQVVLGFNRGGGGLVAVEDAAHPEGDDWAFNDATGAAGFDADELSLIGASLLVATPDRVALGGTVQAPWGPNRIIPTGFRSAAVSGRIGVRALATGGTP